MVAAERCQDVGRRRSGVRRPPVTGHWCTCSRTWTETEHVYDWSVTELEETALYAMAEACA